MSPSLARLRFIHYGGWIVFGKPPGYPGRRSARRSGWRPRPAMLFMSNYDGDPHEYLAAFGISVKLGMRLSFGSAAGFPDPQPTGPFIDYVESHRIVERLHYSAYPDATVRDVDTALEVAGHMEDVRALGGKGADETQFEKHYRALCRALALAPEQPIPHRLTRMWHALWRRSTVTGFAAVVPVEASRKEDVVAALDALAEDPASLFGPVGGVHFARLAILPIPCRRARRWPLGKRTEPAQPPPEHLLFLAWFDGAARDFVDRLVAGLGPRADDIWSGCTGYPGTDDPRQLASWITAHRLRFSLFLGSRSGVTVEEIRAARTLEEQVRDVVTTTQGKPLRDIRLALAELESDEQTAMT